MKNILKKITGLFLLLVAIPSVILATSLFTSTEIPILGVGHQIDGQWKNFGNNQYGNNGAYYARTITDIKGGEQIAFQIHSYANGGDVSNLINKLKDLRGQTFSKNTSENVTVSISSSSTSSYSDSVILKFDETVKLEYAGSERGVDGRDVDLNSGVNTISSSGISLGNLSENQRSNLIVYFRVIKLENPKNGSCGFNDNKNLVSKPLTGLCSAGNATSFITTTSGWSWKCSGSNGGLNKKCSADKKVENVYAPHQIYTKSATKIGKSCANLNGYFDLNDDEKANVSFIYNKKGLNNHETIFLGTKKDNENITKQICGLSVGTRYQFKAVTSKKEGIIKEFVTQSNVVIPPKKEEVLITKWVSHKARDNFKKEIIAEPGENIYYKILVINNTNRKVENIEVVDNIPYYLEFDNNTFINDKVKKEIKWYIPSLNANSRKFLTTEFRILESATSGEEIRSRAKIISKNRAIKYDTNYVNIIVNENLDDDNTVDDNSGKGDKAQILRKDKSSWIWVLLSVIFVTALWFIWRKAFSKNKEEELRREILIQKEQERLRNLDK